MGILSFFTGHNSKESDVYANYNVAESVIKELEQIRSGLIANAQSEVVSAISKLNSVKGLAEYVGTVNEGEYVNILNTVNEQVTDIQNKMSDKVSSIKEYEESSTGEKILSTGAMIGSKVGEGFLSIFEGIGDGIVSVVGWVAPKDSGLEKACASYVEKDLAHDAFKFYYDSEFAKSSMITEESAIAKAAKFGGQMVGFTALGAGITSSAKILSKSGVSSLKSVASFLSTAKKVGTAEAALMAMGSTTQAGLKSGKTMNQAALRGAGSAVAAGIFAYAVGTLFEKAAVKRAQGKAVNETAVTETAGESGLARNQFVGEDSVVPVDSAAASPKKIITVDEEISGFSARIEAEKAALNPSSPTYEQDLEIITKRAAKELKVLQHIKDSGYSSVDDYLKALNEINVDPELQSKITEEVASLSSRAAQQEPGITAAMEGLDGTGELVGLEHKLKTPDSMSRKVAKVFSPDNQATLSETVQQIDDSVRYTRVINPENYEQEVISNLQSLEQQGYKIQKIGNSWANPKYKGLNVTLSTPDDLLFEVQFHTPESFYVKENLNHAFYEINRNRTIVPGSIRKATESIMRANQSLYVTETPFINLSNGDILSLVRG